MLSRRDVVEMLKCITAFFDCFAQSIYIITCLNVTDLESLFCASIFFLSDSAIVCALLFEQNNNNPAFITVLQKDFLKKKDVFKIFTVFLR